MTVQAWLGKFTEKFKKKPLEERLPKLYHPGDPRVAIRPLGGDWLCPYTGTRLAAPDWNGSSLTLLQCREILEHSIHLLALQESGSNTQMLEWEHLVRLAVAFRLKSAANYKISSSKGEWVCPHCLANTGILLQQWDGSETPAELWIPQALAHLQACQAYLQDPLGAKPIEEMNSLRGERSAKTDLVARVAAEAVFHLSDSKGAFFCPFCQKSIKQINLIKWSPAVQEAIVEHFLSKDCPGRYSQWQVKAAVAELQALMRKRGI